MILVSSSVHGAPWDRDKSTSAKRAKQIPKSLMFQLQVTLEKWTSFLRKSQPFMINMCFTNDTYYGHYVLIPKYSLKRFSFCDLVYSVTPEEDFLLSRL